MTVCVAALCEDRKTIVLVSDRLISYSFVQSEPEVGKRLSLHKNWHVLMAGDDIDPIFDIVDLAKEKLKDIPAPSLATVKAEMFDAYKEIRRSIAEARYISPRGVSLDNFIKEGMKWVPESDYLERVGKVDEYELRVELLVAGFDEHKVGHVFSIESDDNRGYPRSHDVGFYAIGGGSTNATFFMTFRAVSFSTTAREMVLYALEGKYWAEEATGVGEDTDIRIIRADEDDIIIELDRIEKTLIPICHALRPRQLESYPKHLKTLNELEELKGFEPVKPKKDEAKTGKKEAGSGKPKT